MLTNKKTKSWEFGAPEIRAKHTNLINLCHIFPFFNECDFKQWHMKFK